MNMKTSLSAFLSFRACLHLLPVEDQEIHEERNLLSAFHLLHEFGIKMLPIQGLQCVNYVVKDLLTYTYLKIGLFAVRLCPDRLRLVGECLQKKAGAHRNPSKLLQLAACLNISNDNPSERQGRVLVLVAEAAFHVSFLLDVFLSMVHLQYQFKLNSFYLQAKDFQSCGDTCKRLVAASYTNGWSIASEVASCSEFKDIAARDQLLSFALQHCPSENLQDLVNIRLVLVCLNTNK